MVHVATHEYDHDHVTESGLHIVSHEVEMGQIGTWLRKGWMDMAHAPVASLFYGLMMTMFVLLVLASVRQSPFLMFALATSFVLMAPFLATGLYDIARQLEQGRAPDLISSLTAWRYNVTDMALYAVAIGVIIAIWSRITPLIAAVVQSQSLLIVDPAAGALGFLTSDVGVQFLVAFGVIGAMVAAFVFAISVVTIPILLKTREIGVISAMIVSFQVTMENKGVMLVWAALIGALVTLGVLTLGFAMIVVMPMLSYASWHAFNDLVTIEPKE